MFRIFMSSVQREFAEERKALAEYIRRDAILGRFFEVFIFEEVPAQDRSASGVYLAEVDACDIYLGVHGTEYGNVDAKGVSATEREYERAAKKQKTRVCLLKRGDVTDPRQKKFISRISADVVKYIEETGTGSRDVVALCEEAGLPRPRWFLEDGYDFRIVIKRPDALSAQQAMANAPDKLPDKVPDKLPDNGQGGGETTERVLSYVQKHPGCNRLQIANAIGLSVESVKLALVQLRATPSRVEHRGSKKTGGYYVLAKS